MIYLKGKLGRRALLTRPFKPRWTPAQASNGLGRLPSPEKDYARPHVLLWPESRICPKLLIEINHIGRRQRARIIVRRKWIIFLKMHEDIARLTPMPVSYTHLDVYKRQEQAGDKKRRRASIKNRLAAPCTILLLFGGEAYGCLLYTSRCV